MTTIMFCEVIYKEVEVYADDIIVKSKTREEHPVALEKFMQRVDKYNMSLNHKKCLFSVTSGKILRHIVSHRGIKVHPDKVKAIQEMPTPNTEKKVWGFLKKLQFIRRFIARLIECVN